MTTPDFELGNDPVELRERQKIEAWTDPALDQIGKYCTFVRIY
jgi:hypothetical protein